MFLSQSIIYMGLKIDCNGICIHYSMRSVTNAKTDDYNVEN